MSENIKINATVNYFRNMGYVFFTDKVLNVKEQTESQMKIVAKNGEVATLKKIISLPEKRKYFLRFASRDAVVAALFLGMSVFFAAHRQQHSDALVLIILYFVSLLVFLGLAELFLSQKMPKINRMMLLVAPVSCAIFISVSFYFINLMPVLAFFAFNYVIFHLLVSMFGQYRNLPKDSYYLLPEHELFVKIHNGENYA